MNCSSKPLRAFRGGIVVLLMATASRASFAQVADPMKKEQAQALLDEAMNLMDEGKYGDACPKLEKAVSLVPDGIGANMALGQCYEGDERFGTAWRQYFTTTQLAVKKGDEERASLAHERQTKVYEKSPKLSVLGGKNYQSIRALTVVDDKHFFVSDNRGIWRPIKGTLATTWLPLDAGSHTIKVFACDHYAWIQRVDIANGSMVTIHAPKLEPVSVGIGQRVGEGLIFTGTMTAWGAGALLMVFGSPGKDEVVTDDMRIMTGTGIALLAGSAVAYTGLILVSLPPPPDNWGTKKKTAQSQLYFGVNPTGFTLRGTF